MLGEATKSCKWNICRACEIRKSARVKTLKTPVFAQLKGTLEGMRRAAAPVLRRKQGKIQRVISPPIQVNRHADPFLEAARNPVKLRIARGLLYNSSRFFLQRADLPGNDLELSPHMRLDLEMRVFDLSGSVYEPDGRVEGPAAIRQQVLVFNRRLLLVVPDFHDADLRARPGPSRFLKTLHCAQKSDCGRHNGF